MPRLRRKTPHEPVLAIPAPTERGPAALARADRTGRVTLRSLALSLNGGRPRPKEFDTELPAFEAEVAEEPVAPFRDRVASREGHAELLVFRVGVELFATELRAVEEAVEGVDAQPIPDAPPSMLGIFALRDRTLPMYSLAHVLGLAPVGVGEMTLVMRPSGTRIAVAVDAVDDVFDAPLDTVRSVPTTDLDGMVLGVVWRGSELVTLLDANVVVDACLAAAPLDSL
jgi:purine-binding chemotaxis protein CheW